MENAELIHRFYQAFIKGDAEGMVDCYHPAIVFEDPAFGRLEGEDAKNMWRMLVERSKGDLKITYGYVQAQDGAGEASWVAEYTFAQTGRRVTNNIWAHFEFRDGKIIHHIDHFDMWKWTRQALGFKGLLLGWSGWMQAKIQQQARGLLKKYGEGSIPSDKKKAE